MARVGQTILNSAWAKMEENGFNHLTVAGVGQTNPFIKVFDQFYSKFQSPCGGRGRSDGTYYYITKCIDGMFQSPYGGRGRSDRCS